MNIRKIIKIGDVDLIVDAINGNQNAIKELKNNYNNMQG